MSKRILLHIGTHKTGTSALQRVFESERGTLASAGIWYPSTNRDPFPQLPKHTSLWAATLDSEAFSKEIALMWREAEAAKCTALLISEEGFSGASLDRFLVFAGLTPQFKIDIFVTLRRQDQYLESLWNQRVKLGREFRSVAEFCRASDNRLRADYVRMLDFWAKIGTVHPTEYGAAKRKGIVDHFTELANLPKLREANFNNPSLGMNDALVRLWFFARNEVPSTQLQDAMEGDLRRNALGSNLRKELLDAYADINAVLAERYGITFTDEVPEEDPAPLTSPDAEFLVPLLAFLSKGLTAGRREHAPGLGSVKPEDLRVAANHLRRSRPDVALRLVQAGLALKPGSIPLKKLAGEIEMDTRSSPARRATLPGEDG